MNKEQTAMIERAKAYCDKHNISHDDVEPAADFAASEVSTALKAERERIADKIEKLLSGVRNGNWAEPLYEYAAQLKENR